MKEEVDFNIFKAQILEEIKAGKPLFGKDGALAPMIENIVNAVLEGEMDAHLTRESRESGNRRNRKGVFPNDTALIKLVYLAYRNARKKWTIPVPNWGIISQQLAIKFEDRYYLL